MPRRDWLWGEPPCLPAAERRRWAKDSEPSLAWKDSSSRQRVTAWLRLVVWPAARGEHD